MTTERRLRGLQNWLRAELCAGRKMKAPAGHGDLSRWEWVEPDVFIDFYPERDARGETAEFVSPSILVMHGASRMKFAEEQRFDQYRNIHRPQEMGQSLAVSLLFAVYEQGTRLPGLIPDLRETGKLDMARLLPGTEEGIYTLSGWMDEAIRKLLGLGHVPGTDLFIDRRVEDGAYSPLMDSNYIIDKRPVYLGFINLEFNCYAAETPVREIMDCLY